MHFTRRGFDPRQPAAFIAEGLLPYLNPEQQRGLLSQVDVLSARGSAFAADRIVGDPHASGRVASLSRRSGVDMTRLIASGENNEIESVLVDRGWNMRETSVPEVATFYGRDLTDPFGKPR